MSLIALPTSAPKRKWYALPAGAVAALAALGIFWLATRRGAAGADGLPLQQTYVVNPMDLDIRLVKDGELQAVHNFDVICMVEGTNTITSLAKEGDNVKKGDLLVTLDSSQIRQKIDDTTLSAQGADADLTIAQQLLEIQVGQNAANLQGAQVALDLAKLDLQQYTDGTYPQSLANAQTDLEMARITLKNKEEDLGRTKSLFAKGFVTAADLKKGELDVTQATNDVNKAETALTVLTRYTHQEDLASKKNALAQAEKTLERVKKENASNLAQKQADLEAKQEKARILKRQLAHLKEQLTDCTITAPIDGLVVYASSTDRNAQSALQEGAQVRERQLLIRVPDTSSMLAVARIPEAQVPSLKEGMRAIAHIVGIDHPIGCTLTRISPMADNSQRWWNPDLKEYPTELTLDETPKGMKPGVGANVEIQLAHLTGVLAVPLSAVYASGDDNYVFTKNGTEVTPVKVKLGQANETHVQVIEGLNPSQEVLILQSGQGHDLLTKAGIKDSDTSVSHDFNALPKKKKKTRTPDDGAAPTVAPATQPAV